MENWASTIFYDVIGENADRKKGCGRYGHKKEICSHVQHRNEDGRDKQQSGCSNEPEEMNLEVAPREEARGQKFQESDEGAKSQLTGLWSDGSSLRPKFTREGQSREGHGHVYERLDRASGNQAWRLQFPEMRVKGHLELHSSLKSVALKLQEWNMHVFGNIFFSKEESSSSDWRYSKSSDSRR
ncbi:hypothetical protein NC651_033035 [Populus alba x Populus x berolinensis]|nr:hypothetical protein NC651_033035 [Populus alba x Populus x berolinensis]